MSNQITVAFVEGFKNNFIMLSQQLDARLWGKSLTESQNSKTDYFERVGTVDAVDIVTRHGDTPIMNTPHSRRAVTLQDAEYGDMVDRMDKIRLLISPESAYVRAGVAALNRKKDDVFIAAVLGSARTGEDGDVLVPLPSSQKIVATDEDGNFSPLNVYTLTSVLAKLEENEAVDESSVMNFAWNARQKKFMLRQTAPTSADYADIKALVDGKITYFMGFNFYRSERLPVTAADITVADFTGQTVDGGSDTIPAGADRLFAWVEDGMLSSIGVDVIAEMGKRADKRFGLQVYLAHSVGAVRMEEEKVVEVICSPTYTV